MEQNELYCYHCFTRIEDPSSHLCPNCGEQYDVYYSQSNELPAGTKLCGNRYTVGKTLGSGGFGITYIGFDNKLKKRVLIKETFYSGIFYRNILDKKNPEPLMVNYRSEISLDEIIKKTEKECRHLSEGEGLENIVKVYDFFSENNTAYIITEYIDGITLYDRVTKEGCYTWDELYDKISPLMESLELLHSRHILHRDIKPQNIMIRKGTKNSEQFVLIDFGLARSTSAKTLASIGTAFSPGYSPIEQRAYLKKDGTYTDVYAIAATIYFAITGEDPNEELGETVEENFPKINSLSSKYNIPEKTVTALKAALDPDYHKRTDSIEKLLESFFVPKEKSPKSEPSPKKADKHSKKIPQNSSKSSDTVLAADMPKPNTATVPANIKTKDTTQKETSYIDISQNKNKLNTKKASIIAASAVVLISAVLGIAAANSSGKSETLPKTNDVSSSEAVTENGSSQVPSSDEIVSEVSEFVEESAEPVTMPSLSGLSVGEAKLLLDDLSLSYKLKEVYSDKVEKGKVISQSPTADTDVDSDTMVTLKVSKGKKAESSLSKKSESSSKNSSSSKKSESSSKNSSSSKKSESSSKKSESNSTSQTTDSNKVVMPDIVGMNYNDAIKLLTSSKLNCTYTSVFDDNVPINEVMTQNPAAGTSLNAYSNVTLTYSIGPQPETTTVTYDYEVPGNDNSYQQGNNGPVIPIYRDINDNTIITTNGEHWTSSGSSLSDGLDFSSIMYGLNQSYSLTPESYTVPEGSQLYSAVTNNPGLYKSTNRVRVKIYYDFDDNKYINVDTYRIYYWYGFKTGKKKTESALTAKINDGSIWLVEEIFVKGTDVYNDYISMGYSIDTSYD